MADTVPILEVKDLGVSYGSKVAVAGVGFEIYPGEIFGLLGPNGAGKTSTLSAIEGLVLPTSGSIRIAGIDVERDPIAARAKIGVQLQATSFQADLHVDEIIALYAGLYRVPVSADAMRTMLEDIGLTNHADKKIGELSGGQRQRVALATATIHNPPLLLLDEPTTGLDPQSRRHLWDRIEAMRDKGHSILLTTHSMEEAGAVADRVAIMDYSKIIVAGKPRELVEKYKDNPDVKAVARHGEVTLEDVFIGLTGRELRD